MTRASHSVFVALALACACGRSGPHSQAPGDPAARLADLRLRLAQDPKDLRAHVLIARLQLERGQPGAAYRHFEIAQRNGALGRSDRRSLARLLRQRGSARLALGDPDAHLDYARGARIDASERASVEERARAHELAGLALLRRPEPGVVAKAREQLRASLALTSRADLAAALDPTAAPLGALATAARWAWRGGARQFAYQLLERYRSRGGDDAGTLTLWLRARRWWGGSSARPPIVVLDRLRAAGVEVCLVARTPAELDCGDAIERAVDRQGVGARMLAHAEDLHWRTSDPRQASAWVAITLQAWAGGGSPWERALARRVEASAAPRAAAFARPTLLRLFGRTTEARAALDRALLGAPSLTPARRAVLVAESAMQDRGAAVLDALLASPTHASGWLAALAQARARGDLDREAALLARAPAGAAALHRWRHAVLTEAGGTLPVRARIEAALSRWRRATAIDALRPARDRVLARWKRLGATSSRRRITTPYGTPDPYSLEVPGTPPAPRALVAIARWHAVEPAVADRLSREYIDGSVEPGERGPWVAALFDRLGDPARAHAIYSSLVEHSPRHAPYLEALALSSAAVGDRPRSGVHAIAATAASGDPAATALRIARRLMVHAATRVDALGSVERAIEHSPAGTDRAALATAAQIAVAMGRWGLARAALARFVDRTPAPYRDAARADALRIWGARPVPAELRGPRWLTPSRAPAGADPARARAWNPRSVAAHRAALARAKPGSPAHADVVVELMALALSSSAPLARPAFEVLLAALKAAGAPDATIAATAAELRSLPAQPPNWR